ncbi:MAG: PPOX class F420-dependent oxidoreductase [Promethearchaeota archaeon]|nr:MAG: PPOX class F420-dependent oxidoreductase [Candidatus Lokiarchaeota archaeon]
MSKNLTQLKEGQHVSIKTFRKDGTSAATPVWFLEDNGKFYICTGGGSYKVRRIQNNPKVEIAASDSGGNLKGEYFEGQARIMSKEETNQIYSLFRKKYSGFRMWNSLYNLFKSKEKKHIYLEIELN